MPAKAKPRILFVEDGDALREISTQVLTKAGFKVDSTNNGTKALQMFRKRRYDLVITDLVHPGLNGAELIGKIYAVKPFHPVLILTASPIPTLTKGAYELSDLVDAANVLMKQKARAEQFARIDIGWRKERWRKKQR